MSDLDLDTLLYTLCGPGARVLRAGSKTIVVVHAKWTKDARKIRDKRGLEGTLAKALELGELQLETASKLHWLKFPLGDRRGMLEIRRHGVRFYGGRIATFDKKQLVILIGAERKDGDEADPALLDRCEKTLVAIADVLATLELETSDDSDPPTRDVTDLTTERIKRRRK